MFIQPEVCVISDLHFGVHQNSPLWHTTAINFTHWLIKHLNNKGVKDIIIAGDVFHNRNDVAVNTLNVVAEIFNLLSSFNIFILVGNHDAFYKDRADVNSINILNGWKNIKVYSKPTVLEYMKTSLAICPWGTTVEQIPNADVIFGHFEIVSFKMNNYKVCDHGINSQDLFSKTDLVLSGHFHLREERKYNNGTIIYLGSPYQLDWGDKDTTKGIYFLDLLTKKYSFIENDISPKHIEIKLTDLIKAKTLSSVKLIISGNIIKFIVDKEIETDKIDTLIKRLASYQPLSFTTEYYCFNQNTENIDIQGDLGVDITKTINDFIQLMDIKQKIKVCDYVTELYAKVKQ